MVDLKMRKMTDVTKPQMILDIKKLLLIIDKFDYDDETKLLINSLKEDYKDFDINIFNNRNMGAWRVWYNKHYNLPETQDYNLKKMREYKQVKEKRKEIENCVICGADISDRESHVKLCYDCAKWSHHHIFIDGKWVTRHKYNKHSTHETFLDKSKSIRY